MGRLQLAFVCAFLLGGFCVWETSALTGHVVNYYVRVWHSYTKHCGFLGWSRCRRYYAVDELRQRCAEYWKDDGTGNCRIPICTTPCYNGGTCEAPNKCLCTSAYKGDNCADLQCSHLYPCYPGACADPHRCTCSDGFGGTHCLTLEDKYNAHLLGCQLTLANIRRADGKQLFYYSGPCAVSKPGPDVMWSNQALFNYANFSMSSYLDAPYNLPPFPPYVTNGGFGIVQHGYHVKHTKIKRDGQPGTFVALDKAYDCPDRASQTTPIKTTAECMVIESDYKINIEDGDVFSVTYKTKGGGFSEIKNLDTNLFYKTQTYNGRQLEKTIEFHFDFIAPVHCSETTTRCATTNDPIELHQDITRSPISPRWSGWSDDRSGLDYYKLEIYRLEPNINEELVEMHPLSPIYSETFNDTASPTFPTYKPNAPGMYSILLQASDKANNSKIARRLVLFDDSSEITLTTPAFNDPNKTEPEDMFIGDGGMHVTTAISETGFMWQTGTVGRKTRITLDWTGHFVNKIHEEGKLLNKVLPYPTQFQELSDSGILRSEKVVAPKLDDKDGMRTLQAIPNLHGIIQFEYCKVTTADREVPSIGWTSLPLEEKLTFEEAIDDGQFLRLWIRANDVMNHTSTDYTEVHIDNSPPIVSAPKFIPNTLNDTFEYTSRVKFSASDAGSGVHKIDYKLFVEGKAKPVKSGHIQASKNNETDACRKYPECKCVLGQCFLLNQSLALDNCWFMVPQDSLDGNGTVEITVYNQALLKKKFRVDVGSLKHLYGLEEYSGPTNIHVAKTLPNGVRLAWDLPKTASCYGRMDITILVVLQDGSTRVLHVYNEATSIDLVGLDADQGYTAKLDLGYEGTSFSVVSYNFKTAPPENYLSGGIIAGIVISVIFILAVCIAIFVILLRRGHMQPVRRGIRAMTVKYRKSRAGAGTSKDNPAYFETGDNRESMYVYGELDFNDFKTWHIPRSGVVFDSLLTTGSFALIYKARLTKTDDVVVAKTLKEGFTDHDELLMKAKLNFVVSESIEHENILKFIGGVSNDSDIGPFMVYEMCERGPLNKYLESQRNNITMDLQENLFRFGLGVVRGMEYLACKKIVHRRLAARNILLRRDFQVKITGFGPLPTETEGDASGKRERIPIKWVAPECVKSSVDATEKSDMWSYGVVLWEIFSLGAAPYGKTRGSDLPAKLKAGTRLPKPENADDTWYGVMQRAWSYQPDKRPTFRQVAAELDQLFVAAPQDDYYYYKR